MEGTTQMGYAPTDTPTATSQLPLKWPVGWPSAPLEALGECQLGERKKRERTGTDAAAYTGETRMRERRRATEFMTGKVWVRSADYWHIFLPGRGVDERNLGGAALAGTASAKHLLFHIPRHRCQELHSKELPRSRALLPLSWLPLNSSSTAKR